MATGDPRKHRRFNDIRTRRRAKAKANGTRCYYCDVLLTYDNTYAPDAHTLDHLIPVSVDPGLAFSPSNLVDACRKCNTSRQASLTWTPPSGVPVPTPGLRPTGKARRVLPKVLKWSRRWTEPDEDFLAELDEFWIAGVRIK